MFYIPVPIVFVIGIAIGLCWPRQAPFSNTLAFGCAEYKDDNTCPQWVGAIFLWIIAVLLVYPLGYAIGSEVKNRRENQQGMAYKT